jgi:large conductance mechanosensitive channel
MLKEIKDFLSKGNLIDIAVGLVMAVGFGTVVSAFVDGLFMPIIGQIFSVGDFNDAKIVLSPEVVDTAGVVTTPESALMYGTFIGAIINFLIISMAMFMLIKGMNSMKKKEVEAAPAPAGPTQEELLSQIRDLLKK